MIAEQDRRLCILEKGLQPLLALDERQVAQVFPLGDQKIEGDIAQA